METYNLYSAIQLHGIDKIVIELFHPIYEKLLHNRILLNYCFLNK